MATQWLVHPALPRDARRQASKALAACRVANGVTRAVTHVVVADAFERCVARCFFFKIYFSMWLGVPAEHLARVDWLCCVWPKKAPRSSPTFFFNFLIFFLKIGFSCQARLRIDGGDRCARCPRGCGAVCADIFVQGRGAWRRSPWWWSKGPAGLGGLALAPRGAATDRRARAAGHGRRAARRSAGVGAARGFRDARGASQGAGGGRLGGRRRGRTQAHGYVFFFFFFFLSFFLTNFFNFFFHTQNIH
jgi:hypothetical protein